VQKAETEHAVDVKCAYIGEQWICRGYDVAVEPYRDSNRVLIFVAPVAGAIGRGEVVGCLGDLQRIVGFRRRIDAEETRCSGREAMVLADAGTGTSFQGPAGDQTLLWLVELAD
jgi:hypothetical protein